ncbi:MAG: hypothetical protein ACXV2E_06645 [Halobacteriota archaeon]
MIERAERERTTRPPKVTEYDDDFVLLLKQVGEIFDISDIIEEPQTSCKSSITTRGPG